MGLKFVIRYSLFVIRYSVFVIRYSVFGIQYSVFGIRYSDFNCISRHTSSEGFGLSSLHDSSFILLRQLLCSLHFSGLSTPFRAHHLV
ncbi:MAG: hypothetical protein EOM83_00205 [Clostridia bacterium]|nr:hypothetical protein [Clostridia bacterium]